METDPFLLNKNKKKTTIMSFSNISNNWENGPHTVCDLGQYVETCCRLIKNWNTNVTWYRGVCNAFYPLTPSLFRHFDPELSLYANQAKFLKDAYYITMSEATLWAEETKSTLEHMCLLQHYGIPTSLLDFSEDMLIALHFALNPDSPEDLKKVDEYVHQPKVVLFNPFKYRNAIMSLQEGTPVEISKHISPFLLDVQDKRILEYCVHDMSDKYLNEHSQKYTQKYEPTPRANLYPQPLPIRRINARIHAQTGTFLAYNLSARPDKKYTNKKDFYAYLGLERIQEDYLRLLEAHNENTKEGKFIEGVYIYKPSIPAIKEQLKRMNITTAHTYPELFRLFTEYMDSIDF